MTNNELREMALAESFEYSLEGEERSMFRDGYNHGFSALQSLITHYLNSLPLDQMSGKQVEESLWNEFLHIQ